MTNILKNVIFNISQTCSKTISFFTPSPRIKLFLIPSQNPTTPKTNPPLTFQSSESMHTVLQSTANSIWMLLSWMRWLGRSLSGPSRRRLLIIVSSHTLIQAAYAKSRSHIWMLSMWSMSSNLQPKNWLRKPSLAKYLSRDREMEVVFLQAEWGLPIQHEDILSGTHSHNSSFIKERTCSTSPPCLSLTMAMPSMTKPSLDRLKKYSKIALSNYWISLESKPNQLSYCWAFNNNSSLCQKKPLIAGRTCASWGEP